jgi:hypothetical protein
MTLCLPPARKIELHCYPRIWLCGLPVIRDGLVVLVASCRDSEIFPFHDRPLARP